MTAVRLALWTLPFRVVWGSLKNPGGPVRWLAVSGTPSPMKVGWAVAAVANRIPGAGTCLVKSMAAYCLLCNGGHVPTLHIGVRGSGDGFGAHSWVECGGAIVVGEREAPAHDSLATLQAEQRLESPARHMVDQE